MLVLISFGKLRKLIRRLYGDDKRPLTPAEKFARSPWATATTPDQLISAYCIQLIAKDFDSWEFKTHKKVAGMRHREWLKCYDFEHLGNFVDCKLFHKEKKIEVDFQVYEQKTIHNGIKVNGTLIDDEQGAALCDAFLLLRKKTHEIKEATEKAKRKMEAEKKKWDLAENLLGLKRLANGALVPKEYVPPCTNKFVKPGDKCKSICCNSDKKPAINSRLKCRHGQEPFYYFIQVKKGAEK